MFDKCDSKYLFSISYFRLCRQTLGCEVWLVIVLAHRGRAHTALSTLLLLLLLPFFSYFYFYSCSLDLGEGLLTIAIVENSQYRVHDNNFLSKKTHYIKCCLSVHRILRILLLLLLYPPLFAQLVATLNASLSHSPQTVGPHATSQLPTARIFFPPEIFSIRNIFPQEFFYHHNFFATNFSL